MKGCKATETAGHGEVNICGGKDYDGSTWYCRKCYKTAHDKLIEFVEDAECTCYKMQSQHSCDRCYVLEKCK